MSQSIGGSIEFDNLLLAQIENCRNFPDENRTDILAKFINLTFPDGSRFSNESLMNLSN